MNAATSHDIRTTKRADELSAGDRIAAGFLPPRQHRDRPAADVLWVHPYQLKGEPWLLIVTQADGDEVEVDRFRAAGEIPVDRLATPDRTLGMPNASPVPHTITEQRFPIRRDPRNGGPR